MGHHRLRAAAGASPADPYFSSTTLLLLGNGTNGGQNNTFVDGSTNNFTITRNGNTTQGSFSPFTGVGGSGYFDGSGDYLEIASNAAFGLGTSGFTIEAWVYPVSNPANGPGTIFDLRSSNTATAVVARIDSSLNLRFYDGPANNELTVGSVSLNVWTHVAFTRVSNTLSTFVNGILSNISTVTSDYGSSQPCWIGGNRTAGYNFNGNISNIRILKGTTQYTTTFTPPTAPLTAITNTSLLLNFTNGSIIDSTGKNNLETVGDAQISTSVKKYGTGSLKFDGTTDVLGTSDSSAWAFGTGDLTIEFWFNVNTFTSGGMYYMSQSSGITPNWYVFSDSSTLFRFGRHGASQYHGFTTALSTGQWYHVAIVRSGTTMYMFLDGVAQSLTTAGGGVGSFDFSSSTALYIAGFNASSGNSFNGYIDDLRITKGVARYTANFTPPSAQLPSR